MSYMLIYLIYLLFIIIIIMISFVEPSNMRQIRGCFHINYGLFRKLFGAIIKL